MIKRGDVSASRIAFEFEYEGFKEDFPKKMASFVNTPGNISSAAFFYELKIGSFFELDLPKQELIDLLSLIAELGKATFNSTHNLFEERFISHKGEKYPYELLDPTLRASGIEPISWKRYFFPAVVLRDAELINFFCELSTDKHYNKGESLVDYYLDEVIFLKLFYRKALESQDIEMLLYEVEVMEKMPPVDAEKSAQLHIPVFGLYKSILNKESNEQFNEKFEAAVLKHRDYWTKDIDRLYKSREWVSLSLLAVGAYAHDHGYEITVESDYAPLWLIKHDF